MIINNGWRMPSSAEPRGRTDASSPLQETNSQWEGIPISNGPRNKLLFEDISTNWKFQALEWCNFQWPWTVRIPNQVFKVTIITWCWIFHKRLKIRPWRIAVPGLSNGTIFNVQWPLTSISRSRYHNVTHCNSKTVQGRAIYALIMADQ